MSNRDLLQEKKKELHIKIATGIIISICAVILFLMSFMISAFIQEKIRICGSFTARYIASILFVTGIAISIVNLMEIKYAYMKYKKDEVYRCSKLFLATYGDKIYCSHDTLNKDAFYECPFFTGKLIDNYYEVGGEYMELNFKLNSLMSYKVVNDGKTDKVEIHFEGEVICLENKQILTANSMIVTKNNRYGEKFVIKDLTYNYQAVKADISDGILRCNGYLTVSDVQIIESLWNKLENVIKNEFDVILQLTKENMYVLVRRGGVKNNLDIENRLEMAKYIIDCIHR